MYNPLQWKDHVTDKVNIFHQTKNPDGTITQTRAGKVIQEGTAQSASNFNNMEHGIFEANLLATTLAQQALQDKRILKDLEGEVGQIILTNADQFPFNNSIKTIALSKNRDTIDYRITIEVISKNENVGDIIITDKQLNGFKLNYTGSAKSVTIKYYVQGGMYQ